MSDYVFLFNIGSIIHNPDYVFDQTEVNLVGLISEECLRLMTSYVCLTQEDAKNLASNLYGKYVGKPIDWLPREDGSDDLYYRFTQKDKQGTEYKYYLSISGKIVRQNVSLGTNMPLERYPKV